MSVQPLPPGLRCAAPLVASVGWLFAAVLMTVLPRAIGTIAVPASLFVAAACAMAAGNALVALRAAVRRCRLVRHCSWCLPLQRAVHQARRVPQAQWLGRGFEWTPVHAQRMHRISRLAADAIALPRWMHTLDAVMHRRAPDERAPRVRVIDAVDAVDVQTQQVFVSLPALASHTLVFGQTGSGKTRLAELLVTSFLARHPEAVVFVIDPKGDRDLQSSLQRACVATGRGQSFISLHPAFPDRSIRFDPLRNFTRTTSLASRIASLLPGSGAADPFSQFAWSALHRVADAMVYAGLRPSLVSLRRYLEDDACPLLAQALAVWSQRGLLLGSRDGAVAPPVAAAPAPPDRSAPRGGPGSRGEPRHRPSRASRGSRAAVLEPGLGAAVARYRERIAASPQAREPAIDGLLSLVLHDPVHFSKMIQHLLPLLTALTTGELGPLLSPDASAPGDRRPVFDARKVIDQRCCLYLGLDSLTDATVGSAIGAIALADLAQVAGELFNHGSPAEAGGAVPVLVFVDEAAEVVNPPLVQLLNKSRGAGFTLYLAAQTVHDYEARLGSAAAAAMLLGNPGNVIALRTTDPQTQRFCTDSLPCTEVEAVGESRTVSMRPGDAETSLSGAIGSRRDYREAELFAPGWLGLLPDLHYLARIAGGRLIKGELPRLVDPLRANETAGRAAGLAAVPRGARRHRAR